MRVTLGIMILWMGKNGRNGWMLMPGKITFDGVWEEILEIVHRTNHHVDGVQDDALSNQETNPRDVLCCDDDWYDDIEILMFEWILPALKSMFGYPENVAMQSSRSVTIYDQSRTGHNTRFGPMIAIKKDVFLLAISSNLIIEEIDLLLDQMTRFRDFFPEYHDCRVMGAVAGLSMEYGVDHHAMNHGLLVIVKPGNTARVVDGKDFNPRIHYRTLFNNNLKRE